MIMENFDLLMIGFYNGTMGTILSFKTKFDKQIIIKVHVNLELIGNHIDSNRTIFEKKEYYRITFPLQLVYVITRHKSQEATFIGKIIIIIKIFFALGLTYIMLSRATNRDKTCILK